MKKFFFSTGNHDRCSSVGLLFLRVGLGLFMLLGHGWGKAERLFKGETEFGDPLGIGAELSFYLTTFAEVVCAAALVVGFMTRLSAVPLVIAMGVAGFIVHANDPWLIQTAGLPAKELALLFFTGFLALMFTGPGRLSVDSLIITRKPRPSA
jgi:putative oxidoreductase